MDLFMHICAKPKSYMMLQAYSLNVALPNTTRITGDGSRGISFQLHSLESEVLSCFTLC